MFARRCQICSSSRTVQLKETIYCEACDVYYSMCDGVQYVSTLPMKPSTQISPELCQRCQAKANAKKYKIRCETFQDYFSRLRYCKSCKLRNKDFLKNHYYKNFLLHRTKRTVFSKLMLGLFLASCYFIPNTKYRSLLFLGLVILRQYGFSYSRLLLAAAITLQLGHLWIVRDACILFCLLKILFAHATVFDIPSNFNSYEELHCFFKKLNISPCQSDAKKNTAPSANRCSVLEK